MWAWREISVICLYPLTIRASFTACTWAVGRWTLARGRNLLGSFAPTLGAYMKSSFVHHKWFHEIPRDFALARVPMSHVRSKLGGLGLGVSFFFRRVFF